MTEKTDPDHELVQRALGAQEADTRAFESLVRMGEELEFADQRGVVTGVTPTKTMVDQDGRTLAVPNHQLLEETTRQ